MDLNNIVTNYVTFLKNLPEAKYYSYFHGNSFSAKKAILLSYLKGLDMSYTEYKVLNAELEDLDDYLQMHLIIPKKKKPVKKRRQQDTDSESE